MSKQTTIFHRTWPRHFLVDFEEHGEALWFYLYLLTHREPRSGYVRGSFQQVAADIGVSTETLKTWLEQLEEEEYVQDESLNGKLIVQLMI